MWCRKPIDAVAMGQLSKSYLAQINRNTQSVNFSVIFPIPSVLACALESDCKLSMKSYLGELQSLGTLALKTVPFNSNSLKIYIFSPKLWTIHLWLWISLSVIDSTIQTSKAQLGPPVNGEKRVSRKMITSTKLSATGAKQDVENTLKLYSGPTIQSRPCRP